MANQPLVVSDGRHFELGTQAKIVSGRITVISKLPVTHNASQTNIINTLTKIINYDLI